MSSPLHQYKLKLSDKTLKPDPYQSEVVNALDKLHSELQQSLLKNSDRKPSFLSNIFGKQQTQTIKGLYIWGGVGRGKTYLCDMFYNTLNTSRKLRLHYHRFMILVHESLLEMDGVIDPIDKISKDWADKYSLLVLDEMHINDITDALLMKRLLEGLFSRGVVLVTTSNVPPDGLYKGGLQRQEFLPAINLLHEYTEVICLDGNQDYRLKTLKNLETYLTPISAQVDEKLNSYFREIAGDEREQTKLGVAIINQREIPIIKRATGVIWFDFQAICNSPRSNEDYIEISNFFHTVIISNVPQMDDNLNDAARRFVNMIDEFYDRSVNLIMSAEVDAKHLYQGKKLNFEFQRTLSRLIEMRSDQYFAQEHGH